MSNKYLYNKHNDKYINLWLNIYKNGLTKCQALYIKFLRIKLDCSWRSVDREFNNRYVFKVPFDTETYTIGNQLDGEKLCIMAMTLLKEDIIKDNWN